MQLIRKARVLIVEDDYGLRTLIKALLAGAGLQVDEAENCNEGLNLSASLDHGVVILDLTRDQAECPRFLTNLNQRCQSAGKRPLVIAMTTSTGDEAIDDDLVALTFHKPFSARDLADVVIGYVANLAQPP